MTPPSDPHGLAALARAVVPGDGELFGGDDARVLARIPHVLDVVPALADDVRRAVDAAGADGGLDRLDPAARAAVIEVVVLAWATTPEVRSALGAPARIPIPLAGRGIDDALLAPVRARGPRWRGAAR